MTETLTPWELVGSWESPATAAWPLWALATRESEVFVIFSRPVGKRKPRPLHMVLPCLCGLPLSSLRALATREVAPFTQLLRWTAFTSGQTLSPLEMGPFPDGLSPVWDVIPVSPSSFCCPLQAGVVGPGSPGG